MTCGHFRRYEFSSGEQGAIVYWLNTNGNNGEPLTRGCAFEANAVEYCTRCGALRFWDSDADRWEPWVPAGADDPEPPRPGLRARLAKLVARVLQVDGA